jgi:hypothetical protein
MRLVREGTERCHWTAASVLSGGRIEDLKGFSGLEDGLDVKKDDFFVGVDAVTLMALVEEKLFERSKGGWKPENIQMIKKSEAKRDVKNREKFVNPH